MEAFQSYVILQDVTPLTLGIQCGAGEPWGNLLCDITRCDPFKSHLHPLHLELETASPFSSRDV
jgi:hypothetical protein